MGMDCMPIHRASFGWHVRFLVPRYGAVTDTLTEGVSSLSRHLTLFEIVIREGLKFIFSTAYAIKLEVKPVSGQGRCYYQEPVDTQVKMGLVLMAPRTGLLVVLRMACEELKWRGEFIMRGSGNMELPRSFYEALEEYNQGRRNAHVQEIFQKVAKEMDLEKRTEMGKRPVLEDFEDYKVTPEEIWEALKPALKANLENLERMVKQVRPMLIKEDKGLVNKDHAEQESKGDLDPTTLAF